MGASVTITEIPAVLSSVDNVLGVASFAKEEAIEQRKTDKPRSDFFPNVMIPRTLLARLGSIRNCFPAPLKL